MPGQGPASARGTGAATYSTSSPLRSPVGGELDDGDGADRQRGCVAERVALVQQRRLHGVHANAAEELGQIRGLEPETGKQQRHAAALERRQEARRDVEQLRPAAVKHARLLEVHVRASVERHTDEAARAIGHRGQARRE